MKFISLFISLLILGKCSQAQKNKIHEIAVSQSFIWNSTTIYDIYSGARASNKSGNAWSYGTNINYSLGLKKELYTHIGVGYFNQCFGIHRGFNFYEQNVATRLFYTTKSYTYKTLRYLGGIGYTKDLSTKKQKFLLQATELRLLATFNLFTTYRQEFEHDFGKDFLGNPNPQIRTKKYIYGNSLILKAGLVRSLSRRIKIGLDIDVPVYNRWRKDEIFKEDMSQYHGKSLSVGSSINLIYDFKKNSL